MALDNQYYLYNYISKNPENSIYELSKKLGWFIGKVQCYIRRLIEDDMITKKEEVVNGRRRIKYSSKKVGEYIDWEKMRYMKK